MRSRSRRIVLCGGLAGLAVAACTVFDGLRAEPAPVAAPPMVVDAAAPDPCSHERPPGPPPNDDAPDTDIGDVVLALKTYTFEPSAGFDLDGVCTCDHRPNTAYDGGPSCKSDGPPACDGDGGIDNQLARSASGFSSVLADPLRKRIEEGRGTALLRISRYNGLANDAAVTVAMFDANGVYAQGCPSSVLDPRRGTWSPGWCGNDPWSLDPGSVETTASGPIPHVFANGYVTNHRLVVRIDAPVPLPGSASSSRLAISSAVLVATLTPSSPDGGPVAPGSGGAGSFAITDGVLAGRVLTTALLAYAGIQGVTPDDGGPNKQICLSPLYSAIKAGICTSADLTRSGAADPDAPCEALSAAFSFTAFAAEMSQVRAHPAFSSPCDPGPDGNPVDASVTYTCP